MKKLKELNQENIIFFDIETVRSEKVLTEESKCYEAWVYKMRNNPEELTLEASFEDKAALLAPFANIVCITIGKILTNFDEDGIKSEQIKLHTIYGSDEKKLLTDFNNLITKLYDKNSKLVYCGFNSNHFDVPMITKRMVINDIVYHQSFDKFGLKPWELPDIDLADAWKGNSYSQDSLISICQAIGIESPKDDISGKDVGTVFYGEDQNRFLRIAKYCEKDVVATINVFKKFRFEEKIVDIVSNLK